MEGHWVQASGFEGMEQILDAVGLTDPQIRAHILSVKPAIQLKADGDKWEYKIITPQSNSTVTFTSGQELDYVSIVGRPVKAQMTIVGNKLIEVHRDPNNENVETNITREFIGDEMTTTLKVNGAVCAGKYRRA